MDVSKKIKLVRVEQGLSSGELADKAGIHINTLSRIENGANNNTSADTLYKIAEALDISFDWLMDEDQGYPPPERVEKKREKSKRQGVRN